MEGLLRIYRAWRDRGDGGGGGGSILFNRKDKKLLSPFLLLKGLLSVELLRERTGGDILNRMKRANEKSISFILRPRNETNYVIVAGY